MTEQQQNGEQPEPTPPPPKDDADSPARMRQNRRVRLIARTTSEKEAGNTIELLEPWDFSI